MKRYALLFMVLTMFTLTACSKDTVIEENSKSQSSFASQEQTKDQEVVKEKDSSKSSALKHEDADAAREDTKAVEKAKQEAKVEKQESKETLDSQENTAKDKENVKTDNSGSGKTGDSKEGSSVKTTETPEKVPEQVFARVPAFLLP